MLRIFLTVLSYGKLLKNRIWLLFRRHQSLFIAAENQKLQVGHLGIKSYLFLH